MSKKKYKKGKQIRTIEELEQQEFIYWQGKVYHYGFWGSWQYRWVIDRLKCGQFFTVERTGQEVFICYEENSHAFAIECGAITDITVFSTAEKALSWFKERVKKGIDSGFVIDRDDTAVTGMNIVYLPNVEARIKEGFAALTMFRGWQENWDESYDICVCRQEVL